MSEVKEPAATDPFFEVIRDTHWNACVGRQGNELNYVDGYMEAAQRLVTVLMDNQLFASRDTLAMPILYNARHALELSLKFTINHLHRISAVSARHMPNHDILSHWKYLQNANLGDAALRQLVQDLEPYVVSLAQIDEDGQELRYPTNRDGQKSLSAFGVVNLHLIRSSLDAMAKILTAVKYRVMEFELERTTGSYTKDCSRSDLKAIAEMLGAHSTWKDESFNDKKDAVRERFKLSSGKFSDAVDAIRRSRQLATLVELEKPLTYISDEKAIFALEQWAVANPERPQNPEDLGMDYFNRDWEKIAKDERISRELDQTIIDNLSLEEFCDLEVLFYIGRESEFGESYDKMLTASLEEHRQEKSRWAGVHHIMAKTNFLENVIAGAHAVGRPSLAYKLRAIRPIAAVT